MSDLNEMERRFLRIVSQNSQDNYYFQDDLGCTMAEVESMAARDSWDHLVDLKLLVLDKDFGKWKLGEEDYDDP